ncbi:xylitol dehydrogenase, partial [Cutaneotrichosporon oleaginosum]
MTTSKTIIPSFAGKTKQKAAVCHGALDLRVEDRPVREPGEGEVQVAMGVTGLCGSDLHYYLHGANGTFKIRDPLVLGHESCGIVTAVGPNTSLAVGDRVALEVGISCRTCAYCKEGRYNLCPEMRFCSSAKTHPHLDGTLCEVMVHPAHLCHKLPPRVTMTEAALAEPLSVVLHAYRKAALRPGARVLVIGAGAVGLLAAALVKGCGASTVISVDIEEAKLAFAEEMGWADATITLPRGPRVSGADSLAAAQGTWDTLKSSPAITERGLAAGFDAVFECTGVETCMQLACYAAATGGKVLFVGMGTPNMLLPASATLLREVDLHGVFRYANTYPEALALLGSGRLGDVGKMVTQRYPLERASEAFEAVKAGRDAEGKAVIKVVVGTELD